MSLPLSVASARGTGLGTVLRPLLCRVGHRQAIKAHIRQEDPIVVGGVSLHTVAQGLGPVGVIPAIPPTGPCDQDQLTLRLHRIRAFEPAAKRFPTAGAVREVGAGRAQRVAGRVAGPHAPCHVQVGQETSQQPLPARLGLALKSAIERAIVRHSLQLQCQVRMT